jgi:VIT1/CCC1 family predicted Fe2+/Mn2+ transporter
VGAALEPRVGLILGLANLGADGLSMGASNYLGLKAELEQTGASIAREQPLRHGLATAAAFAAAGSVPLLAYFLPRAGGMTLFQWALLLSLAALLLLGVLRARLAGQRVLRSAAEMLAVGGLASGAAYGIGLLAQWLI